MPREGRHGGREKSRCASGSSSRSSDGRAQEATPAIHTGLSDGMNESIPLREIKVLDRDGQIVRDDDVSHLIRSVCQTIARNRRERSKAMPPSQAIQHSDVTPGLADDRDGEVNKANEVNGTEIEERVPEADEAIPGQAPSDCNDPRQVSTNGKLDEELVGKVLQDALEEKCKPEDPWAKCAKEVWEFEESLVEKWKEDINNLLLFSGLFSTVLTGFIVPFYVTLAATQALISMSAHLSVVAADAGHTAVANWLISLSSDSQSSPRPSSTTIAVAVLWFAALILSLGAASVAISISQWLHHHINVTSKTSQRSVRVWFFRRRGLRRWGVEQAVAVLPLLLQIALVLFLVGLDVLLWTINTAVAEVATALISLLLLPTIVTPIIPSLSPDCPFKSAQAWAFFRFWRWAVQKLERPRSHSRYWRNHGHEYIIRKIWNRCCRTEKWRLLRDLPALSGWRELDNFCMQTLKDDSKTRLRMLVEADSRVMDESFLSTVVRPCLQQADVRDALPAFYKILDHRAHDHDQDKEHSPQWWIHEQDHEAVTMLGHMSLDMFNKVALSSMDSGESKKEIAHVLNLADNLLNAMPCTMPAVYSRLMGMWAATNLPDEVRVNITPLAVAYHSRFNDRHIDINFLQKMIPLLPIASREVSMTQFVQCLSFAFKNAVHLPPCDFAQLREAIQGALAAVAEYFSPSGMESLSQEITQANAWINVFHLSTACVTLAEHDASLFTENVVDALSACSNQCPSNNACHSYIDSSVMRINLCVEKLHNTVLRQQTITEDTDN